MWRPEGCVGVEAASAKVRRQSWLSPLEKEQEASRAEAARRTGQSRGGEVGRGGRESGPSPEGPVAKGRLRLPPSEGRAVLEGQGLGRKQRGGWRTMRSEEGGERGWVGAGLSPDVPGCRVDRVRRRVHVGVDRDESGWCPGGRGEEQE